MEVFCFSIWNMLTGYYVTARYCISSPSGRTDTYGIVVDDAALSVSATSTGTRILTFKVDASLRRRAFRVRCTLGSAFGRNAQVARLTRTNWCISDWTTNTMRTTRRWVTWFFNNWWCRRYWNWSWFQTNRLSIKCPQCTKSMRISFFNCSDDSNSNQCLLKTGIGRQDPYGSPVYDSLQLQTGMWLVTRQSALDPHAPAHGSTHLLREQLWSRGQSVFNRHSGLHELYGSPM